MSEKICSCCGNVKGCDCFSTQSQQFSRIAELEALLSIEKSKNGMTVEIIHGLDERIAELEAELATERARWLQDSICESGKGGQTMIRDESLTRFAAERVMGWKLHESATYGRRWSEFANPIEEIQSGRKLTGIWGPKENLWTPLASWNDAGALWEKAQEIPSMMNAVAKALRVEHLTWFLEHATPRAITEAICRAYGWTEESVAREGEQ